MSQQPEAIKHAEWLKRSLTIGAPEAAAELRRLHAVELEAIALRAQVERLTRELHQATNPPFTGKTDSWQAACGKARTERDEARAQVERLQAEAQGARARFANLSLDIHRVLNWEKPLNGFDEVKELQDFVDAQAERLQAAGQVECKSSPDGKHLLTYFGDEVKKRRCNWCSVLEGATPAQEAADTGAA